MGAVMENNRVFYIYMYRGALQRVFWASKRDIRRLDYRLYTLRLQVSSDISGH